MMSAVYLPAKVPAQSTPNNHIRGKVLLGRNSCDRDRRREPIGRRLAEPTRIFMGPDACNRPSNRRVFRGKRSTTVEKIPVMVPFQGALALCNFLEQVCHGSCIDGRFPAEQSTFLQVIVTGHVTEQE